MREDEPIATLAELGQVESPEVVRAAMRRFRRRLLLWGSVVTAAVIGLVLVVTAPTVTPWLPARMADAGPVWVMQRVEQEPIQVLVLDAARLEESYVLRLVVSADSLDQTEGVFVAQRFAVWDPEAEPEAPPAEEDVPPPPAGPAAMGGVISTADSGFGAGSVQEVWVEVPLGSRRLTLTVGAGVPAGIGADSGMAPGPMVEGLLGPPTEPGTERVLGEVELDVAALGINEEVWG
jgi:hypothetical protein